MTRHCDLPGLGKITDAKHFGMIMRFNYKYIIKYIANQEIWVENDKSHKKN